MRHAVTLVGAWPFNKVDNTARRRICRWALVAGILPSLWTPVAQAKGLYDDLDKLGEELRAPEAVRRRDAVDKLDAFGGGEATRFLTELLNDGDPEVKARAALSVGRHHLTDLTGALLTALGDGEPRVRAAAAEGLGLLGDVVGERGERALERRLGDSENEVRLAALTALGRLSKSLVERSLPAVAARLDDDHAGVRVRAAEILGRLGDHRAVVPLIGRLDDSSREVRALVLDALAQIGDEKAASAVSRLLRDPVPEVALRALDALGQLGGPGSAAILLEAWERGSGDVFRAHAGLALGRLVARAPADSDVVGRGVTSLLNGLGREPAAAKEGLWLCGARAVPAVATRIPVAAGDELNILLDLAKQYGDATLRPVLLEELRRGRAPKEKVIDALGALLRGGDRDVLPSLLALLSRPEPLLKRRVLTAIGGYADGRAVAVLVEAAGDSDRQTRMLAITELGRLGLASAGPALVKALGSSDGETATAAARALGILGLGENVPVLIQALDRDPPSLRREAADALAHLAALHPNVASHGPELLRRLRTGNDRRPDVLAAVAGLYRGHSDPVARELLMELAEGDAQGVEASLAVAALGAMGDPAASSRLVRLLSRPVSLRRRLVAALGDLRPPADRTALLAQLASDDNSVAAEAAWALGKHPEAGAETALKRALSSSDPALRANAAGALARLDKLSSTEADRLALDAEPAVRANALASGKLSADRQAKLRLNAPLALPLLAQTGSLRRASRGQDFVVVHLAGVDGAALPETAVRLQFPDGVVKRAISDLAGDVRENGLPSGACQIELAD